MRRITESPYVVALQIIGLFLLLIFFYSYVDLSRSSHIILAVLLLAVVVLTLFLGSITGLVLGLLILFFIGSMLVMMGLRIDTFITLPYDEVSYEMFIVYGVALILSIVVAGLIQKTIAELFIQREQLKNELELYSSTDPATFFDNERRMKVELAREVERVKRHKGKFTLMLLELDHAEQFLQVYGKKEFRYLLENIGRKTNTIIRNTDRKFRYAENRFAFLFFEMKKENIEIISQKFADSLQKHQLLNGKYVTLSFHMSFEEYSEESTAMDMEDFFQNVESELVFYAL